MGKKNKKTETQKAVKNIQDMWKNLKRCHICAYEIPKEKTEWARRNT